MILRVFCLFTFLLLFVFLSTIQAFDDQTDDYPAQAERHKKVTIEGEKFYINGMHNYEVAKIHGGRAMVKNKPDL